MTKSDLTPFFRLLAVPVDDKGDALRAQVAALNGLTQDTDTPGETFAIDPAEFGQIPGSPFAYWVGESIRRLFETLPSLAENGISAQHGASSKSDFRFLRLAWEVPPETIGKDRRWVNFAKGGQYSPYYADVHLLINWENDAQEIKDYLTQRYPYLKGETGWILHPENNYFQHGITWPRRPHRRVSFRFLPSNCIFADNGPAFFCQEGHEFLLLAIMNSVFVCFLTSLSMGRGSEASGQTKTYEVGIVQRTPIPDLCNMQSAIPRRRLAALAHAAYDLQRERDRADETAHAFCLPGLLTHRDAPTLREAGLRLDAEERARQARLAAIQAEIDALVFDLYGLSASDRALVLREMGGRESESANQQEGETAEQESEIVNLKSKIPDEDAGEEEDVLPPEDLPARVANLLMWCVGVAFGRWDLRKALDPGLLPPLGGPFAPLPRTAPGGLDLRLPEGASEIVNLKSQIENQGILPDDPTHPDDLIGRVQATLRALYGARAEAIEAEACALLGFDSLRAYFRDPRKGLFAFHIKRYSKSRRKAPIYWLLQSERRNYGIWLYCHRLEKYALYSAARDYADYKVNFEQGRLDDLKELLPGLEGPERRRREREFARQQPLVDEVRTFRQRLDAVAKQDLFIDLNDGVLISLAPLWELVPWKEAARVWEQLLAGEYEWSTMGKRLREKGLIAEGKRWPQSRREHRAK